MKLTAALFVIAVPFLAPFPAGASEISMGRDRAIESCSACHQVTRGQKPPALVPNPEEITLIQAPSFAQIAAKYEGRDKELRAFIIAPTHPMKEQQFLESDLNAISAYIHSAKTNW